MLAFARAAARRTLSVRSGDIRLLAPVLAGAGGAALGAYAGHLVGRSLPLPLVTGGVVSAAIAGSVVAAHRLAGAPAVGRAGVRAALWGTLVLALLGQAGRAALDYQQFRRAAVASLVAGPGAPTDPDLYLDIVLLAETGQPGFRGYLLATLGVDRGDLSMASLRLRVLGHLIGVGLTAALAAHVAQASVRAARCGGCRRRAERCACGRGGADARPCARTLGPPRRGSRVTDVTGEVGRLKAALRPSFIAIENDTGSGGAARRAALTRGSGTRILRAP